MGAHGITALVSTKFVVLTSANGNIPLVTNIVFYKTFKKRFNPLIIHIIQDLKCLPCAITWNYKNEYHNFKCLLCAVMWNCKD